MLSPPAHRTVREKSRPDVAEHAFGAAAQRGLRALEGEMPRCTAQQRGGAEWQPSSGHTRATPGVAGPFGKRCHKKGQYEVFLFFSRQIVLSQMAVGQN